MRTSSSFRGVFSKDERDEMYNPSYWKEATRQFPNGVPRFLSKVDAIEFTQKYCQTGSNPDAPDLRHNITTLIDWDQIEKHLIPKINDYNKRWPVILPSVTDKGIVINNRYMDPTSSIYNSTENDTDSELIPLSDPENGRKVYQMLISRLDLSVHRMMTSYSTMNTLKYLFYHMKCGIYVMIRNNEVVIFCPFVNQHYKNNWGNALQIDSANGNLKTYYKDKLQHYREENILHPSSWWANGNIICNEDDRTESAKDHGKTSTSQWWGDQFLFQLKDMLAETCAKRDVPDCEFFLNKRDYPQLKFHPQDPKNPEKEKGPTAGQSTSNGFPVEPYGFIYDKNDRDPTQDIPLTRHAYKSYAPIMSFYTSDRFADIPIPPSEDWEAATGEVFPPSFIYEEKIVHGGSEIIIAQPRDLFTAANLIKFEVPWGEKVPTGFFRGTATGGGVTCETNQRLHVAELCYNWSNPTDYPHLCGRLGTVGADSKPGDSSENKNGQKKMGKLIAKPAIVVEDIGAETEGVCGAEQGAVYAGEIFLDLTCSPPEFDFLPCTASAPATSTATSSSASSSSVNADDSYYPYLDAKITGWNIRDKKVALGKMTYLRKSNFQFEGDRKKNFVEIYKQGTYKYLLYIEGHCAACRYGFMMQLGSVILKVESTCVADQMWYFPLLVPFRDHVPVKPDLSDLEEKIKWCRDNDDKCRDIARTAQQLYKMYVSKEGILDYMQAVCVEVSKRWRRAPVWADNAPPAKPSPSVSRWHEMGFKCTEKEYCSTCQQMMLENQSNMNDRSSGTGDVELSQEDIIKARIKEKRDQKRKETIRVSEMERMGGDAGKRRKDNT